MLAKRAVSKMVMIWVVATGAVGREVVDRLLDGGQDPRHGDGQGEQWW